MGGGKGEVDGVVDGGDAASLIWTKVVEYFQTLNVLVVDPRNRNLVAVDST
jgi:hypothetical protein